MKSPQNAIADAQIELDALRRELRDAAEYGPVWEVVGRLDASINAIKRAVRYSDASRVHHTANDISHEIVAFTLKSDDDEFRCLMCGTLVEAGETGYAHHHHEFCSEGCAKEHQIVMARRPVKVGP